MNFASFSQIDSAGHHVAFQLGKKPTKVAVRKLAREARWQQKLEISQPDEMEDQRLADKKLNEARLKTEKDHRYWYCRQGREKIWEPAVAA